ncbi:MAG: phosphoribosylglycinamide formyltransferase [Chitinophagales bacterium]|nr:phosphoribosylglycinamide formyltransferase [Chitinophagales bacterium]
MKLAIFLSGTGSNAKNICSYFDEHQQVSVALLLSNNENSGVKNIAASYNIPYYIFSKTEFKDGTVLQVLQEHQIDTIILAGFLWLIPNTILDKYKVINIHPALLPKYGGKGMHGMYVHQAVHDNKEKESGITIHLCNEVYDDGQVLFQAKVDIAPNDTPKKIAEKVLQLEHQYFPKVIDDYCFDSQTKEK